MPNFADRNAVSRGRHAATGGGEHIGRVGEDCFRAQLSVDPLQRTGCQNHRAGHRHRLQHFVLDAAGNSHWRDAGCRMGDIRPHIWHPAGDEHAIEARQLLHVGTWVAADDMELRHRQGAPDQRQNVSREPGDRIGIRRVIHRAGEHVVRPRDVEQRRVIQCRVEIAMIDAVADSANACRAIRMLRCEQISFRVRGKSGKVAFERDAALQLGDLAPLPPIDDVHRTLGGFREHAPFLGIDIHQINHPRAGLPQIENSGRHIR
jgi:hypothetical protein